MFYIYQFYSNDSLLYIGKSKNIFSRFYSHKNSKDWFTNVTHIHIAECKNKTDMDIYELYYINKLSPLYNITSVNKCSPTFKISELKFNILTVNEFNNKFVPTKNPYVDKFIKRKNAFNDVLKNSIDLTNKDISIIDIQSNKFHWYINDTTIKFIKIDNYELLKLSIDYIIDNNINLSSDFEMPINYNELSLKDNYFINIYYTHYDINSYKETIRSGCRSLTESITLDQNRTPIFCDFINEYYQFLFSKNLSLKHLIAF